MARIFRWVGRGFLAVIVLLLLATAGVVLWLRTSLPQLDGELIVAGLDGPVTVARDAHGIPRIRAESMADAHRALGFLHAQDRLFQMEATRRIGRGRLAEVAGASVAGLDRRMRTYGLARLAEADAETMPDDTKALFQAYADGVNAFMATHTVPCRPSSWPFPRPRYPGPWRTRCCG